MTVRPLDARDIPAALSFWPGVPGLRLDASDEPHALTAFFARNAGLSWGAFDGERLAATVLAGHDARRGFLYHLAVDPAYRGQGWAAALMDKALGGLAACGIIRVHAHVLADNASGLLFWAAAGRRGWYKRDDLLLFSRNL